MPRGAQVARGAIAGVVTGHYPLNNNAARVGLEHLEAYYLGWRNLPVAATRCQTAGFVLVTLAIGLTVRPPPPPPSHPFPRCTHLTYPSNAPGQAGIGSLR